MFNHQKLKCYQLALDVAKRVPTLTEKWPSGSGYLTDQLRRAASSVVLNISEGNGRRSPKDRKRFFDIARASSAEVASIFDIAEAYDFIDKDMYLTLQDKLLQIFKMLYKLR